MTNNLDSEGRPFTAVLHQMHSEGLIHTYVDDHGHVRWTITELGRTFQTLIAEHADETPIASRFDIGDGAEVHEVVTPDQSGKLVVDVGPPMFDELKEVFPSQAVLDRTSMNTWEDAAVIAEVNRLGKDRLIMAGLWTSVCIVGPVVSAIDQGYDVYFISDACGDVSTEAHERAVQRMIQLGATPLTSLQYLLELQRDWARGETYASTTGIAQKWAGGYGLGVTYARTMFNAQAGGH